MKKVGVIALSLLLVSCGSSVKTETTESESFQDSVKVDESVLNEVDSHGQVVGDLIFYPANEWENEFKTILESKEAGTQYSLLDFERDLTPELIVRNVNEFSIYKFNGNGDTTKTDIPLEYDVYNTYFYQHHTIGKNLIGFGDVGGSTLMNGQTYYLEDGSLKGAREVVFSADVGFDSELNSNNLHELNYYELNDYAPIDNYYGRVIFEDESIVIFANDEYSASGDVYNYDLMHRSLYILYKSPNKAEIALIEDDFDQPVYSIDTYTLAYLVDYQWESVATMQLYDVNSRTISTANLNIKEGYKPSYIRAFNEYIVFVDMYSWGTVAQGGNINVYNIETGESYPIVVCNEENVQIVDFVIKDGELKYNFVVYDENMNLFDSYNTTIDMLDVEKAIETKEPIVHTYENNYINEVSELDYNVYLAYTSNTNIPNRDFSEDKVESTKMEYSDGVALWADETLYDVKIIGLNYVGGTLVENSDYEDKQEFGDVDTNGGIILKRDIPEGVPYWAVSFKDEAGEEVRLVLTYDGSGFYEVPTYMIIENK